VLSQANVRRVKVGVSIDELARHKQPLSLIAEAAIASFLSPDADERCEAAMVKRLDQQDRRLGRVERDGSQRAARRHPLADRVQRPGGAGRRLTRVSTPSKDISGLPAGAPLRSL